MQILQHIKNPPIYISELDYTYNIKATNAIKMVKNIQRSNINIRLANLHFVRCWDKVACSRQTHPSWICCNSSVSVLCAPSFAWWRASTPALSLETWVRLTTALAPPGRARSPVGWSTAGMQLCPHQKEALQPARPGWVCERPSKGGVSETGCSSSKRIERQDSSFQSSCHQMQIGAFCRTDTTGRELRHFYLKGSADSSGQLLPLNIIAVIH